MDTLPLTLLGIRTTLKEDLQHSSPEVVYGTTLRLPEELLASQPALTPCSIQDFVANFQESLESLWPVQPCTPKNAAVFASQDLDSCSHVFLVVDGVRRPLQQAYQGPGLPLKVLHRTRKTFTRPSFNLVQCALKITFSLKPPCFPFSIQPPYTTFRFVQDILTILITHLVSTNRHMH